MFVTQDDSMMIENPLDLLAQYYEILDELDEVFSEEVFY